MRGEEGTVVGCGAYEKERKIMNDRDDLRLTVSESVNRGENRIEKESAHTSPNLITIRKKGNGEHNPMHTL